MFTKGLTLDDGSEVQFVVNDIPEGLRLACIVARRKEDGMLDTARLFYVTITDATELQAIEDAVYLVDVRLHPENYEDEDDDESDDENGDADDESDDENGDDDAAEYEDDDDEEDEDPSEAWKRGGVR